MTLSHPIIDTKESIASAQLYLYGTDLTIQACTLRRPTEHDIPEHKMIRRHELLGATLATIEHWLGVFSTIRIADLVGINVDLISGWTQCLVVLFKLNHLNESGWDLTEVRMRADVYRNLDHWAAVIEQLPAHLGITDAHGPRRGFFFRTPDLFRAIKTKFMSHVALQQQMDHTEPEHDHVGQEGITTWTGDPFEDHFLTNFLDDTWLADAFDT